MSTVIIYGLHDPRDGELRYVGKTKHSLSLRLAQHMTPKELSLSHRRAKWLRCLKAQGLKPEAGVIEVTTAEEWKARECHWIAFHREQGANLVNGTDGGDGGATSKGKPCSEARREAISRALKGHKVSERVQEWCKTLPAIGAASTRYTFDDALLTDLYVKQGKTAKQIGALLGVTDKPVLRRLRELGICRDLSAAVKLRGYKGARGRGSRPQAHKTQCKRGHVFTPENSYVYTDGRRDCRECKRWRVGLQKQRCQTRDSRCE